MAAAGMKNVMQAGVSPAAMSRAAARRNAVVVRAGKYDEELVKTAVGTELDEFRACMQPYLRPHFSAP
jgi:hypothetical protein